MTNGGTAELERLSVLECLRRFVPAPVADAILSDRLTEFLTPHRCEVVVVFFDLRGFCSFAETTEPEEVANVLRSYHFVIGHSVRAYGGTLERFTGDGTMIFFNDPVPVPEAARRAVDMALDLRDRFEVLGKEWRARGHVLGVGTGIAKGYATAGIIGFDGRWDYGVIGPVTNLAARLCQAAQAGQVLACRRVVAELGDALEVATVVDLELKGLSRAVRAYDVRGLRADVAARGR